MMPCRLIRSEPADGAMNMALDEALLESAAGRTDLAVHPTEATLRIYRWSRPTLSLGYFQAAADRDAHEASRQCDLVRRPSGGGAILHDRELTYALVLPEAIARTRQAMRWYLDVHNALIAALRRVGNARQVSPAWDLHLVGDAHPTGSTPFLCFQRRALGDVLIGDHKIAGSAQRRRRGAILQHGSVLLSRSPHAPELPGINDLSDAAIDFHALAEMFRQCFGTALNLTLKLSEVTDREQRAAEQLNTEKYSNDSWTLRR